MRHKSGAGSIICGGLMRGALIMPEVSEKAMSIFLREVSDRHPDEFIPMIMDGAGWHKAKALSVPYNVALIFLPPYSPELNPVEHIWDSIREDGFRNEVFNSIEGVENQLMQSLAALERDPAKVASMTGFPTFSSLRSASAAATFGEMALLTGESMSADVEVLEEAHLRQTSSPAQETAIIELMPRMDGI